MSDLETAQLFQTQPEKTRYWHHPDTRILLILTDQSVYVCKVDPAEFSQIVTGLSDGTSPKHLISEKSLLAVFPVFSIRHVTLDVEKDRMTIAYQDQTRPGELSLQWSDSEVCDQIMNALRGTLGGSWGFQTYNPSLFAVLTPQTIVIAIVVAIAWLGHGLAEAQVANPPIAEEKKSLYNQTIGTVLGFIGPQGVLAIAAALLVGCAVWVLYRVMQPRTLVILRQLDRLERD